MNNKTAITIISLVLTVAFGLGGYFGGLWLFGGQETAPSGDTDGGDAVSPFVHGERNNGDASPSPTVNGDNDDPGDLYEHDETGFAWASFSYRSDDNVLTEIMAVVIQLDAGREIQFSDLSDFRLTRDGQELPVSFAGGLEINEYYEGEGLHYFLNFAEPHTQPGSYEMTFTLFGKTREVYGGNSMGQVIEDEYSELPPQTYPNANLSITIHDAKHMTLTITGIEVASSYTGNVAGVEENYPIYDWEVAFTAAGARFSPAVTAWMNPGTLDRMTLEDMQVTLWKDGSWADDGGMTMSYTADTMTFELWFGADSNVDLTQVREFVLSILEYGENVVYKTFTR
jgi:hypothetical protein